LDTGGMLPTCGYYQPKQQLNPMTKILDPTGAPVMNVVTDTKKAHDPEELHRERIRLNNVLHKACEEFGAELAGIPNAPETIVIDRTALRLYHGDKFKALAQAMNAGSFPHPVDEQAMYKQIDAIYAAEQREMDLAKPLAQVSDLEAYDLHPLVRLPDGLLHVNDRAAVCISEYGATLVWLRGKHEATALWASGWLPTPQRMPVVDSLDYTLGELMNLVGSTRCSKVSRLTDEQMEACLKPMKGNLRNWWQP